MLSKWVPKGAKPCHWGPREFIGYLVVNVRSDACFRLDAATLGEMIEKGWHAGVLTFIHAGARYPHAYQRHGDGERGAVALEYDTIFHGHQGVGIRYAYQEGSRRRLWQCPNCGRTVGTLYRPHGGAYFLCRHCWQVRYSSQYEGARDRMWRRYHRGLELQEKASTPAQIGRANQLLVSCLSVIGVFSERELAFLREESESRRSGRPSTREQRPPGRPRTHRAYHRHTHPVLSPRRSDILQGYCPRCRDRRELVAGQAVTFRNGRPAIRGHCATCQTTMARIVAQNDSDL